MQNKQQQSSGPPAIQPAPSVGSASASLAYSLDTEAMDQMSASVATSNNNMSQPSTSPGGEHPPEPAPNTTATADETVDYSMFSSSEMSAEEYYAAQQQSSGQYAEYEHNEGLATVNENQNDNDATPIVHDMHRKLLLLLSHPELFSEAMEWQSKVDRGLDPSKPDDGGEEGNGIKSFDNEFEDQSRNTAAEEHKDEVVTEDGQTASPDDNEDGDEDNASKFKDQTKLIPPLPVQIFALDAEVVLPQALTASQLFGIERVTGIELEAAAGIIGLSQLFLRWLALMPEGDHMNVIDPPGLTVMRISGGRYRVTGAHRVVWRWMNKFSPASMFAVPSDAYKPSEGGEEKDTDFDFGDLVTMTIIDVFETDSNGKLLSYCPTFDNRAVHKTQEVTERLRKGASQLKETIEVVARSPAGRGVNKVSPVRLNIYTRG